MGTSGGYVGLELRREERVPELMWHGQPLGALWPPQCVDTACSSVTLPSWLRPTRPAARCMYNCVSLCLSLGLSWACPVCMSVFSMFQIHNILQGLPPKSLLHPLTHLQSLLSLKSLTRSVSQVIILLSHLMLPPRTEGLKGMDCVLPFYILL